MAHPPDFRQSLDLENSRIQLHWKKRLVDNLFTNHHCIFKQRLHNGNLYTNYAGSRFSIYTKNQRNVVREEEITHAN